MFLGRRREKFGLIILGNSGVGKSFLVNIILDRPLFRHQFSARSVTDRTESTNCTIGGQQCRIYNIPGLIEGNTERFDLNRREIQRAFNEEKYNSIIIIYVFGHQNGRIRHEDIMSFQAIHQAYAFSLDSLIVIVNGLPRKRSINYNEDTRKTLIDLLGMKLRHVCFIDQLDATNIKNYDIRQHLLDAISNAYPRKHIKTDDIHVKNDEVDRLKTDLGRLHIWMTKEQEKYTDTLAQMEQDCQAMESLSDLRRLFCRCKMDLHQLAIYQKQARQILYFIEYWEDEEIRHKNEPHYRGYRLVTRNKDKALEDLKVNQDSQDSATISLNRCRRNIEQICYELEQIYGRRLGSDYKAVREYYELCDDLQFDESSENA
ncbi:unnamed protein product [Rotaria sp. Silwood2]|nr:unnamed protein product [Rotaria sp. Silwood2]